MSLLAWGVRWTCALSLGVAVLWPRPSERWGAGDPASSVAWDGGPGPLALDAPAATGRHASTYRLDDLILVRRVLERVDDAYVEPSRVDPEAMYVGALEAVERALPGASLRRSDGRLSLQLGTWRGALEVPRVRRLDELTQRLVQVAALIVTHVGADAVGGDDPRLDPYAAVEIAMANGALATLDPHSVLLSPDAWREMEVDNAGEFGGLGVQVRQVDGRLVLEHVVPGTPAARAGLAAGDVLRRVDGAPLINLPFEDAVELLRGPVGAPVRLEVERVGGAGPSTWDVTVYRATIPTAPVDVSVFGDRVAVARVRSFHADVADDLRDALADRAAEPGGLRGIVLDLRGNPGGYLTQAVRMADLFLAEGEIVSTRSARDPAPRPERASPASAEQGLAVAEAAPLVVLVDAGSASASEIVAGALARNDRGVVVGERTFGKGSVQNLLSMPMESRLKLTIAHYLTPGGRSIQEVGIEPDIELAPVWVEPDGDDVARVGVHAHRRARREVDLASHLAPWRPDEAWVPDAPSWSFRYLGDVDRPGDPPSDERPADPSRDAPLRLALDLLAANLRSPTVARTGSGLLAVAGGAVAASGARLEAEVAAAMARWGVDWSPGPCPPAVALSASFEVEGGEGGSALTLPAGGTARVTLRARRAADDVGGDAHRVVAVLEGHPLLEGLEFPLGRIRPGGEARWTADVAVPAGSPPELGRARLVWRDEDGRALGDAAVQVAVTGPPRPTLSWSVSVDGGASGLVEVGRPTRLNVSVRNLGEAAVDGVALRLRSRAGAALDVLDGVVRVDRLAPGATQAASFLVLPSSPLDAGWPLEVVLTDPVRPAATEEGEAAPLSSPAPAAWVLRAGPAPAGPVVSRAPPQVRWERPLALTAGSAAVSASGVVSDDRALASLVVYHGADKVLALRGAGVPGVGEPFQFDVTLQPGRNVVSVVAVDDEGSATVDERVVWLEAP